MRVRCVEKESYKDLTLPLCVVYLGLFSLIILVLITFFGYGQGEGQVVSGRVKLFEMSDGYDHKAVSQQREDHCRPKAQEEADTDSDRVDRPHTGDIHVAVQNAGNASRGVAVGRLKTPHVIKHKKKEPHQKFLQEMAAKQRADIAEIIKKVNRTSHQTTKFTKVNPDHWFLPIGP